MSLVTALVSFTKWDEDRSITTTPRVTPAHVSFTSSDIKATLQTEYLMTYVPNGNAEFIFTETVEAKDFQGKMGSFVTQGKGSFDSSSHSVVGSFEIVKGSGTAGLENASGRGSFGPAEKGSSQIKYEFVIDDV